MTATEALDCVRLLLAAYPTQRQRMSGDDAKAMHAAYTAGLEDLDAGRAKAAITLAVKSARWIPTIAEIRAAAVDLAHGTRKPGGQAWGEAVALIRRYGSHRQPGVDFRIADPFVAAAVRAFGWGELCRGENPAADRARFIELYEQLSQDERKAAQIAPGATSPALPRAQGVVSLGALVAAALPEGQRS